MSMTNIASGAYKNSSMSPELQSLHDLMHEAILLSGAAVQSAVGGESPDDHSSLGKPDKLFPAPEEGASDAMGTRTIIYCFPEN